MRITSAATPIEIAQSVRVVRFPHLLMDVWSNPVQAEIKAGTQPRRQSRQSLQPTPYGSKTTTLKYPCPVAKRTLSRSELPIEWLTKPKSHRAKRSSDCPRCLVGQNGRLVRFCASSARTAGGRGWWRHDPNRRSQSGNASSRRSEKKEFPGFGFSAARRLQDSGAKDSSRRQKNCVSEDQKWATGCILSDKGNPKWKSRAKFH